MLAEQAVIPHQRLLHHQIMLAEQPLSLQKSLSVRAAWGRGQTSDMHVHSFLPTYQPKTKLFRSWRHAGSGLSETEIKADKRQYHQAGSESKSAKGWLGALIAD